MARRFSWSDVRGGMLASLAIVVAAGLILVFSRVGALHGDTFRLYAIVGEARGVLTGSEVWLSGQKVGRIVAIDFRSPAAADTSSRILIEMQLLERYRAALHRDAIAQIRSGGSLIGPPVVYLSPGTTRTAIIRHDDTVRSQPQADVEGAASQFTRATKELPVIIGNVKLLNAELQSTRGTAGAFLNGSGTAQLQRAGAQANRLMGRLSGPGTAGLILRGGLAPRTSRVLGRVDSIRALLGSSRTSLGRFRRDSTLLNEVADIRNELTLVRADLDGSRGTAGRFLHDSSLVIALGAAEREMAALLADLKKHPMRYLAF